MDSSFVAGGRRSAWRPGWIRVRAGEERADWPARQTRGFGERVQPLYPSCLVHRNPSSGTPSPPYQTSKMSLSVDIHSSGGWR